MLRVKLWSCVFRVYVAGYGITRLFPLAIRNSIKSIHVELRGLKLPSPLQMNGAQEISQTIRISRSPFLVSRSNTASNVKQPSGEEYSSKMKMREKLHEITLVRVLKATKVLRIRDGGRGLPLLYVFVGDALRASPLLSEHRPGNTKFVRELYVYVPHRSYIAFHFRNRRSNFPRGGKRRLRHDRGKNILLRGGIALPSSGCLELLARLSMAKAARVTGKLRYPAVSTTSASV